MEMCFYFSCINIWVGWFCPMVYVCVLSCLSHVWLFVILWTVAQWPTRLVYPLDPTSKNTGVSYHYLLQGIFLTHGWNACLLHSKCILYPVNHLGSPCHRSMLFEVVVLLLSTSPFPVYESFVLSRSSPTLGMISFVLISNACMLSYFSHVWLFATPWTVACQAPLSMGLSRQEYWSELPSCLPGNLPHPGIKPVSLTFLSLGLTGGFFSHMRSLF